MPSKIIKGIPTIVWGTDNIMNAPSGAIIESLEITPKNGEPIEIEDNQGFAAALIILNDGFNAKVKIMFDSAKVYPNCAGNVGLNLPLVNGNSNGATSASYTCLIASDPEQSYNRKKEAMLGFNLVYRPGVAV